MHVSSSLVIVCEPRRNGNNFFVYPKNCLSMVFGPPQKNYNSPVLGFHFGLRIRVWSLSQEMEQVPSKQSQFWTAHAPPIIHACVDHFHLHTRCNQQQSKTRNLKT